MLRKIKGKFSAQRVKDYLVDDLHSWLPFAIVIAAALILTLPFVFRSLFVSGDYASGGINTVGNTVGNVSDNAVVCQQGDWLYFRYDKDNRTLYKCRTDGSDIQQVIDDPGVSNINVIGKWIYYRYRSVYKVRVDGKCRTELSDQESAYVNVVGDWIYFCNFSDNCYPYKMKTDGSEMTKIADVNGEGILVADGFIYLNDRYGTKKLYKMSVDATDFSQAVPIAENICVFNVVGDWVYYSDYVDFAIYKVRTNGTEKTKLTNAGARVINVYKDKIYYVDSAASDGLFSIRTDGTDKRMLIESDCMNVNIASDIIFYTKVSQGNKAPILKLFMSENMGIPVN